LHLAAIDLARSAGGNPVSSRDRVENGPSNAARDKYFPVALAEASWPRAESAECADGTHEVSVIAVVLRGFSNSTTTMWPRRQIGHMCNEAPLRRAATLKTLCIIMREKANTRESLGQGGRALRFHRALLPVAQLSFNCHNYPLSSTSDLPIHSIPLCWTDSMFHK
jgi:hypothetical protein